MADVAKVTRGTVSIPISEAHWYLRGIIIPAISRIVVARLRHTDALRTYSPTCNVIAANSEASLRSSGATCTRKNYSVGGVLIAVEKERRPAIRERYLTPGSTGSARAKTTPRATDIAPELAIIPISGDNFEQVTG